MRRLTLAAILALSSMMLLAAPVAAEDTFCGAPSPEDPETISGTHDNVIVPTGTACVLLGATVRGYVLTMPESEVEIIESSVGGDVRASPVSFAGIVTSTVRGSVLANDATVFVVEGSTVSGNIIGIGPNTFIGIFGPDTTVHGNVQTSLEAAIGLDAATIHGSVTCDNCFFEDVFNTTVNGNVSVRHSDLGDFMCDNTIGGHLEIFDSRADFFAEEGLIYDFELIGNEVGGNVLLARNTGVMVVNENEVSGNLQVSNNVILGKTQVLEGEGCRPPEVYEDGQIIANMVGGNLQVTKNEGLIDISLNQIAANLQCSGNVPAPHGGGNVAAKKQGQCRNL